MLSGLSAEIVAYSFVETAGGWADLHPDGPVTGGSDGATYYFNEASSYNGKTGFEALWAFIEGIGGVNLATPMILIWTGGDISLPAINFSV